LDAACDCATRQRPLGWSVALRGGYRLLPKVAIELQGGYVAVREEATRTIIAQAEAGSANLESVDYRDSQDLNGAFGAVGLATEAGKRFPVTGRAFLGLARLSSQVHGAGSFRDPQGSAAGGSWIFRNPTRCR